MSLSELSVSDLGQIVTGKTPSTKNPAFFDGEYQFVTPSDLDWKTYYCQSTERTVTEDARQILHNQFIPANTVMVTCIGNTIGKCGLSSGDCLTNQQINSIIPGEGIDPKFVYYLLVQNIGIIRGFGLGGGSATPILNKNAFSRIKLRVPPKPRWTNIAAILSAYDDLIENNRRRIQLLEQAARLLYKEWFIHLRFPGHEHTKIVNGIPAGWEKGCVGNLARVKSGFAFKSKDWQQDGNPVIKIKNIVGDGTIDTVNCDCVSDNVADAASIFEIPTGTLLIAMTGATVGKVGIMPDSSKKYFLNQRVGIFKAESDDPIERLLYPFFQGGFAQTQVQNLAGGAAQPNISGGQIESIELLIPDGKILKFYLDIMRGIFQQRQNLLNQNEKLVHARDLLLPRLMNGEIAA